MHPAFPKCTLLFRNAPDSRENAPRFSGMHPTLRKMHPAFSEMHPEKSKMHPSLFFGAFFYQNMSTKPTERQGYVPTQIIEKREILTVRVSLSHFYPTLIRQLPSHFCFKTLLWVLAQGSPLRERTERSSAQGGWCGPGQPLLPLRGNSPSPRPPHNDSVYSEVR